MAVTALTLTLAGCATVAPDRIVRSYPRGTAPSGVAAAPYDRPVASASGTGSKRAIWQLRSALNVAALLCRSQGQQAIGARYNRLLRQNRAMFADAYAAEQARFRQTYGKDWLSHQDHEMTRLYNTYASPDGQQRFCSTASAISVQALDVDANAFGGFAVAAVARLDAPFASLHARSR